MTDFGPEGKDRRFRVARSFMDTVATCAVVVKGGQAR